MSIESIPTTVNLGLNQTDCLVAIEEYSDETIYKKMLLRGTSFLSSIYIKSISAGGSVKLNYFDTTTSTEFKGERYDLNSHDLIDDNSEGKTFRITVDNFHNKPIAELIVVGTVKLGVYITVTNNSAIDLAEGASAATTENSAVGSTVHFNSTVMPGNDITYPAVQGNFINSLLIENTGDNNMGISFDSGVTFKTITPNNNFVWTTQAKKDFILTGDSTFESIINFSGVS